MKPDYALNIILNTLQEMRRQNALLTNPAQAVNSPALDTALDDVQIALTEAVKLAGEQKRIRRSVEQEARR